MKRILVAFALTFALSAAVDLAAADSGVIRVDPKKISILANGNEKPAEKLRAALSEIVGVEVPFTTAARVKKGMFVIRYGEAPRKSSLQIVEDDDEEVEVVTKAKGDRSGRVDWEIDENGVRLWGELRRGGFAFLTAELGFQSPWKGVVLSNPLENGKVVFRKRKGSWTPPFGMRNIRGKQDEPYLDWAEANLAGKDRMPPMGHAFTPWWFKFCDDHPEYFGMRPDGKRLPYGADDNSVRDAVMTSKKSATYIPVCPSCTGVWEQVIADWRAHGKPDTINLCENDARPWQYCRCPACMALDGKKPDSFAGRTVHKDAWPGWRSDRYMHMCAEILKRAKAINPKVEGGFYAYNVSELPPQRVRVPDNLIVGLVPTWFTTNYVSAIVKGWQAAGAKKFFYRPNRRYYYNYRFLPVGYERDFFENMRVLNEAGGLCGFDYDGPAPLSVRQFIECWYQFKFMSDPTKSFEYWDDVFCGLFGPAKADVKAYMEFWRANVWEKEVVPRLYKIVNGGNQADLFQKLERYFSVEKCEEAAKLIGAGLRREGLTDKQRMMVQTLVDECEHTRLFVLAWTKRSEENSRALYEFRKEKGLPSGFGFEKGLKLERFSKKGGSSKGGKGEGKGGGKGAAKTDDPTAVVDNLELMTLEEPPDPKKKK